LIKNKSFSTNWFLNNFKVLEYYLPEKSLDKFNYLEIGSFEGMSALFILNKFKNANVTCIDQWKLNDNNSQKLDFDFINVEKKFDENLNNFSYTKIKETSIKALDDLKKKNVLFDCIYIDGSHDGKDILNDAIASFDLLNKKGLIIFDDISSIYDSINIQPHNAFETFYYLYKKKIKILYLKTIAVVKKTNY